MHIVYIFYYILNTTPALAKVTKTDTKKLFGDVLECNPYTILSPLSSIDKYNSVYNCTISI